MDQLFSIQCPRHPKHLCEVFTTQLSSPNSLLCLQCLQEEAIEAISLQKQRQYYQELAPFKNSRNIQKLEQITTFIDFQAHFLAVEKFFDGAERSLIEEMRKKKKEILEQIASIPNKQCQVLKEYQQISKTESLRKVLSSNLESKRIEEDLRCIIEQLSNNAQTNSEKLQFIINSNRFPVSLTLDEAQTSLDQLIQEIPQLQILAANQIPISVEFESFSDEQASITYNQSNYSLLKVPTFINSSQQNGDADCQLANTLQCDKKYILKLQFINYSQFYSSVSLIPQRKQSLNYCIDFFNYGYDSPHKIINGQEIWSRKYYDSIGLALSKKVADVELWICIQDKYVVVLDSPSYTNTIQILSPSPKNFLSDCNYEVVLNVYGKNDSITVEELCEVDEFPDI